MKILTYCSKCSMNEWIHVGDWGIFLCKRTGALARFRAFCQRANIPEVPKRAVNHSRIEGFRPSLFSVRLYLYLLVIRKTICDCWAPIAYPDAQDISELLKETNSIKATKIIRVLGIEVYLKCEIFR